MVNLTFIVGLFLFVGCCLFAVMRGDAALKSGGYLLLFMNVLAPLAAFATELLHINQHSFSVFVDIFTTLVISFGFLYLGYRHASIWLAPAMSIQGVELYILSQMLSENVDRKTLIVWDNVISCGVAIALVVGTIASARQRTQLPAGPVFKSRPDPTGRSEGALVSEIQDAVFVFHLPQEDAARLMRLASDKRVLPSQYVRDLISTFLEGDHYAKAADEDSFSSAA